MGYCENRNEGPSVENPELANDFLFKREVGQNTALRASATARNSTVLFSKVRNLKSFIFLFFCISM